MRTTPLAPIVTSQHTAGPWIAKSDSNGKWSVVTDSMHLTIATLGNAEVDEHDAKFIASAPSMETEMESFREEIEWLEAENKELRQRPTFQKVQDLLLKIAQQQKEIQRLQAFEHVAKTF